MNSIPRNQLKRFKKRENNRDLYFEAKEGNYEEVDDLITRGADINSQVGDNESSPLHVACQNGHTEVVRKLLTAGANANLKNKNGQTPLHLAGDNKQITELLLQFHADVNAEDNMGRTPLFSVANCDVAKVLLKAGADVTIIDKKIRNPLHYTSDGAIIDVISQAGADVNLQDENQRAPVHEAAWYDRSEAVISLLRNGCKTDIRDNFGLTPLQISIGKSSTQVTEILQSYASNIPLEILMMDERSIEIYKEALKSGKEKVYHIRLMVVGPFGVGKTTLINRLLQLGFDAATIESTNGIDVHVCKCAILVPDGDWIFQGVEVDNLKNYELRLGRVIKSHHSLTEQNQNRQEEDGDTKQEVMSSTSKAFTDQENIELTGSDIGVEISSMDCGDAVDGLVLSGDTEISSESATSSAYGLSGQTAFVPSLGETKDDMTKNLRKIIDAIKKHADAEKTFGEVSVWDFGGQFIFYSTHQTFLSPRGIYIIVVDISKTFADMLEDDECFMDISGVQYQRMGEYVLFWLKSIHTYASGKDEGVPPVIFVATHLDKVKGDKETEIEKFFDKISDLLANDDKLMAHLVDDDFALDNTKSEDDSEIQKLRQKIFEIASKQSHWGEEIPASWIALEKALMDVQKSGTQVVSLGDIVQIDQQSDIVIGDKEGLDVFLNFQHSLGNIIYFSDLADCIILRPQWLIDAFKCLITAEKFCKRKPAIKAKWIEFSNNGILHDDLIDDLWKRDETNQFYQFKDDLLWLLEKLDIISKPAVLVDESVESVLKLNYYLVPCMLKTKISQERMSQIMSQATSTPCLMFKFEFIPPAVFHRLLAACMKKWQVASQGKENTLLLYCGCGIFDIDKSSRLLVSLNNYIIRLQVFRYHSSKAAPDVSRCAEIREFVADSLTTIFGRYQQQVPFKLKIKCDIGSDLEEGLLDVDDDLMMEPDLMCQGHTVGHSVHSVYLLKYWYLPKDYQHLCQGQENIQTSLPFNVASQCPSEKVLACISKKIGLEYYQLGIHLGLTTEDIQQIQHDHPNNLVDQCFHILRKWTIKYPDTPTYSILEKAMSDVGINVQILYESLSS